jgi:hypothetical protein
LAPCLLKVAIGHLLQADIQTSQRSRHTQRTGNARLGDAAECLDRQFLQVERHPVDRGATFDNAHAAAPLATVPDLELLFKTTELCVGELRARRQTDDGTGHGIIGEQGIDIPRHLGIAVDLHRHGTERR